MDSRRLAYLKAFGVDVWERPGATPPAVEPPRAPPEVSQPKVARVSVAPVVAPVVAPIVAPVVAPIRVAPVVASATDASSPVASYDWATLEHAIKTCTRCDLHTSRTQGVVGVGNRAAEWMVIGEAPGADEDRQGEPFVGRAGQLLNSMLRAIGLAREQVYIANILKSRPPNNRDPRPDEVHACIPYLFRQIELINPRLILCVGRIAAQTLLTTDTPIGKLRGKVHTLATGRPMIVTYHPAYLLRSPGEKRKSWSDLVMAMHTFASLPSTKSSGT
jgi:uracil-DNA glycosylase family 4